MLGSKERTRRVNLQVNLGAQEAIPAEDSLDEDSGVDGTNERHVDVRERRHPAEGVQEGGLGEEVVLDSSGLLLGRALAEVPDDAADLFYCEGGKD